MNGSAGANGGSERSAVVAGAGCAWMPLLRACS